METWTSGASCSTTALKMANCSPLNVMKEWNLMRWGEVQGKVFVLNVNYILPWVANTFMCKNSGVLGLIFFIISRLYFNKFLIFSCIYIKGLIWYLFMPLPKWTAFIFGYKMNVIYSYIVIINSFLTVSISLLLPFPITSYHCLTEEVTLHLPKTCLLTLLVLTRHPTRVIRLHQEEERTRFFSLLLCYKASRGLETTLYTTLWKHYVSFPLHFLSTFKWQPHLPHTLTTPSFASTVCRVTCRSRV